MVSSAFLNSSRVIPYLYSGKEIDRMHGLNVYDFSARWQDPANPGFTTMDPLAEQTPWDSPYAYCGNDPVNRVDPTGKSYGGQEIVIIGHNPNDDGYIHSATDATAYEWSQDHSNPNNGDPTMAGWYGGWANLFPGGHPSQSSVPVNKDKELKKGEIADKSYLQQIKDVASSAQKWVKKNKSGLLGTAQSLQTTGNATLKAGVLCAAVGAPVAGVGAAPGMGLATFGGLMSTSGTLLQGAVEAITGDTEEAIKTAVGYGIDRATGNTVGQYFPGGTIDNKAINSIIGDFTSSAVSTFNVNTIDNYIFEINQ